MFHSSYITQQPPWQHHPIHPINILQPTWKTLSKPDLAVRIVLTVSCQALTKRWSVSFSDKKKTLLLLLVSRTSPLVFGRKVVGSVLLWWVEQSFGNSSRWNWFWLRNPQFLLGTLRDVGCIFTKHPSVPLWNFWCQDDAYIYIYLIRLLFALQSRLKKNQRTVENMMKGGGDNPIGHLPGTFWDSSCLGIFARSPFEWWSWSGVSQLGGV